MRCPHTQSCRKKPKKNVSSFSSFSINEKKSFSSFSDQSKFSFLKNDKNIFNNTSQNIEDSQQDKIIMDNISHSEIKEISLIQDKNDSHNTSSYSKIQFVSPAEALKNFFNLKKEIKIEKNNYTEASNTNLKSNHENTHSKTIK
jgi:hypothetical protein